VTTDSAEKTDIFLDRKFPICSIVRPTETKGAAMGAVKFLTDIGLFRGQSSGFFALMTELAEAADAARRGEDEDQDHDDHGNHHDGK
jgi:hypothetical protein